MPLYVIIEHLMFRISLKNTTYFDFGEHERSAEKHKPSVLRNSQVLI